MLSHAGVRKKEEKLWEAIWEERPFAGSQHLYNISNHPSWLRKYQVLCAVSQLTIKVQSL